MKFHVASRGVTIKFGFPAGWFMLIASLARFYKKNKLLYLVRQATKLLIYFIFASAKGIVLLWWLYCYNFTDFDRKLIDYN